MAGHELVEKALAMLSPAIPTPERGSHEWWTAQWKDLARATDVVLPDDPRVGPVLDTLAICDKSFKAADTNGFEKAAKRVQRLMLFVQGARVWWEGEFMRHRLGVLGPATVEQVSCSDGRLWAWVSWQGIGRWVNESIITKIEGTAQ